MRSAYQHTVKVDLHVHTIASGDSLLNFSDLANACLARGLDGVAVCDHNAIWGALEVQRFCENTDIRVIVGEEINTTRGEIIGLFLSAQIPPGLSLTETIAAIREQGGVVYVPHPFDRFRARVIEPEALISIESEIDVLEVLNARNWTADGNRRARVFAAERHLLQGAGSDAHSRQEVGNAYVVMRSFETAQEFLERLCKARIEGCRTSPFLRLWLKLIKIKRGL